VDTAGSGTQKADQASFFDEADTEFEVSRPHGTPWFYRRLLAEKFRRSLDALPLPREGLTALTICGGSGMDAEFLARVGASVISTDISLGAAQRTRERARRYGFDVLSVVADAEALPLRDRSVDLLFVHDGLHHLDSPQAGIREMLRASRLAISINEPARAGATMLAARVGLSEHYEEAGNFIARLDPEWLASEVSAAGFEVVKNERYAMVYRHEPGRAIRVLSRPVLRDVTLAALQAFNAVAGGIGNKLTLQAVRRPEPSS
jgi:SAM-dependent methyltransferase